MTHLPPGPETRANDPLAVAVGNGSLLGVGYLMLGRRGTALATGTVTLGLVITLALTRTVWMELVLAAWWAAMIGHGLLLARRPLRPGASGGQAWRPRAIAFGVAIPVLLVIGGLRWDAAGIDADLNEARDQGDCTAAGKAVDQVWFGHRFADAPMTARSEATEAACGRIAVAQVHLDHVLSPPVDGNSVAWGFNQLDLVLTEQPGHERMVETALDGFLDRLPVESGCDTVAITDEIGKQEDRGNELDRAAGVVSEIAPSALLRCGAELMSSNQLDKARARYHQLLVQYPGHELAEKARQGILNVQLAEVRNLGQLYCDSPTAYAGAPPYRKGVNRALFHGYEEFNDELIAKLPGTWRTADEAEATLIVCTDTADYGAAVDTCFYERKPGDLAPPLLPGQIDPGHEVTFHKIVIGVQAFELRTGKRVINTKVTIGGASCPKVLRYETYFRDFGPSGQQYVIPSAADIRSAFGRIIVRK